MKRLTTPSKLISLYENEIFVFGSNSEGIHSGGAAAFAAKHFGAEHGVGEGLTGQSYAFPTLRAPGGERVVDAELIISVEKLFACARENSSKQFLVTKVGCGIAGFAEDEIKSLFLNDKPDNISLPVGWASIKGYKAFNDGLKCHDFQYAVGETFVHEGDISMCATGFHFCRKLNNVYEFYRFGSQVAEVDALGDVVEDDDGSKSVTTVLRIGRILADVEAANNTGDSNTGYSNTGDRNTGHRNTGYSNTGDRNTGHSNTGYSNTGDWNTGHRNTGDSNTGHWNTGHSNTGDWNSGDRNTGDWNTGDSNTGYSNTGDRNTGHRNTGDRNTGDWNTGDWNTGDRNSGDRNTGYWNTGDWNTGDRNIGYSNTGYSNTGDWNTGDRNTGHRNTGHSNTGDWNTGDWNTGNFNTITPDEVLIFNKVCSREVWKNAYKPYLLYFNVKTWVSSEEMTDEEKLAFPSAEVCGGYVRHIDYKDAFRASYERASDEDKEAVKNLPNFDAAIFEEISGIHIETGKPEVQS